MRVMPWEGSGRYSPGPGMVKLLEKWFYQELRPLMAICSLNPPGNLAIVSLFVAIDHCRMGSAVTGSARGIHGRPRRFTSEDATFATRVKTSLAAMAAVTTRALLAA